MRLGLLVAGLVVAALAALFLVYPAAAAAGCPSCYGFVDDGDGIYVEGSASLEDREAAKAAFEAGRSREQAFYERLDSHPRVLLCATDKCYCPSGGGSRGIALLDQSLILSPRGADTVIAAHELAHVELHRRIGLAKTLQRTVPQWFDDGWPSPYRPTRVISPRVRTRCRSEPDGRSPSSRAAWIAQSADL